MMTSDSIIENVKKQMDKSLQHVQQALQRIRAGRTTPSMLSHLQVDYYGSLTPLPQVAAVTNPDPKTLHIKPWEKSLIPEIEKTIQKSDLDITPQNNGEIIILSIPTLSEERREKVLKQAKKEAEQGRITIRGIRKGNNEAAKKDLTISQDDRKQITESIQKLTSPAHYCAQPDWHVL